MVQLERKNRWEYGWQVSVFTGLCVDTGCRKSEAGSKRNRTFSHVHDYKTDELVELPQISWVEPELKTLSLAQSGLHPLFCLLPGFSPFAWAEEGKPGSQEHLHAVWAAGRMCGAACRWAGHENCPAGRSLPT